jgi:hypothetical protein
MEENYNKQISNYLNKTLKFTINNFRIFDAPQTFELAPITILTGSNSSGKFPETFF